MHNFALHTPDSLEEALILLDQYGDYGRPIAGGTALVTMMKNSLVQPDHVINLRRLADLRRITFENGEVQMGALVRHREAETSDVARSRTPMLAATYSRVATVRIRNMATVGGGLAHADPAQDPAPTLMALNATVRIASAKGERVIPVTDLFQGYYETALEQGEIITFINVPTALPGSRSTYIKYLPGTEDDYATVSVAAIARVDEGLVREIRVALGAVAPTPIHATAVEDALRGREVTPDAIRNAAEAVAHQVDPLDDFRGSADYKRDMAVVHTRRALEQVLGVGA